MTNLRIFTSYPCGKIEQGLWYFQEDVKRRQHIGYPQFPDNLCHPDAIAHSQTLGVNMWEGAMTQSDMYSQQTFRSSM